MKKVLLSVMVVFLLGIFQVAPASTLPKCADTMKHPGCVGNPVKVTAAAKTGTWTCQLFNSLVIMYGGTIEYTVGFKKTIVIKADGKAVTLKPCLDLDSDKCQATNVFTSRVLRPNLLCSNTLKNYSQYCELNVGQTSITLSDKTCVDSI